MKVYLQILQSSLLVSCFITSLVYKRKLQKNGIEFVSYASPFNIIREYYGKDNCSQVLKEEIYKMFGTKYLNDEHDCNVVSMNSIKCLALLSINCAQVLEEEIYKMFGTKYLNDEND